MSSKTIDIALLTENKYVNPTTTDWYIDQVLQEDGLVKSALEKLGYSVEILDWADQTVDWSQFKVCVFRTIWDYFHRFDEFTAWIDKVKTQTTFVNSIDQILWNVDKHYLGDLAAKGIPTVETHFIERNDQRDLGAILHEMEWSKTVLKPCISGAARHTYKINSENVEEHETIFKELIKSEAMMLQPFIESITSKGEVSHVVIGGKYSHSVLKKAKEGDYRVQDDFGGSVHPYEANQTEKEFAELAAKACEPLPTYARIDVVWGNQNELLIGEVELIEPELWFRNHPSAADHLAQEIDKKIKALA